MRGWKECKECHGSGWRRGPGSIGTCHEEPEEPYGYVAGEEVMTESEAKKMVGG